VLSRLSVGAAALGTSVQALARSSAPFLAMDHVDGRAFVWPNDVVDRRAWYELAAAEVGRCQLLEDCFAGLDPPERCRAVLR
jgi:hypothetical protein